MALGANLLFVGALGFVSSGRIGEPLEDCLYNVDADTVIRITRYPVYVGADYNEQQFFLVSHDTGESWEQVTQAYASAPLYTGCGNVERPEEAHLVLNVERKIGERTNEIITYESLDRGETWRETGIEEVISYD